MRNRRLLWSALLCLTAGCSADPSTGCTLENCRRMVTSCRVDLLGGPTAVCSGAVQQPEGFDWTPYCVDNCRLQRAGALVSCIAFRADRCDAADGGLAKQAIVEECAGGSSGPVEVGTTCDMACEAQRRICDLKCVGGQRCADCIRNASSCEGCADGGYAACTDCSAQCGHELIDCLQKCPSS